MLNKFLKFGFFGLFLIGFSFYGMQNIKAAHSQEGKLKMSDKVEKSEQEWQSCLTPEQFRVVREKGTEAPFSGKYNKFYEEGTYHCVACNSVLFSSLTKYDSGSGWPSFWDAVERKNIEEKKDNSLFMTRTEILCSKCGAHLGHIFNDGPKPTGMRYCVNSASLKFVPVEKNKEQ